MKKTILLSLLSLATSLVFAQEKVTGVVKLRGTRLTYPLVNKWIAEFKKEYPDITVKIAPNAPADSIDISLAAHSIIEDDLKGNREAVALARYVQLPVANSKREDLAKLQEKGFTEAGFSSLYFSTSSASAFGSAQSPITLYTREKPACAAITFARHFEKDPKAIQGVGVKGDDQDLANAVRTDINGVSFNNLGFIYDTKVRTITPNLAIIPLDLNENGKIDKEEQIYGTLDEVIAYIERTNNPKFVTENVNALYVKGMENTAAGLFLSWVLSKGQKFNHELGFLLQEEKSLNDQKAIIQRSFKASSTSSCEGMNELSNQRKQKLVAATH